MLGSKKVIIAMIGVLLLILRQHTTWLQGWDVLDIVKPIGGYLFAQGMEDWGKSEIQGDSIKGITETLKEMFGQRKTGIMLTQLLIGFTNQFFPGLIDNQTATWAINLLLGSTVAIGVADVRKAASKLEKQGNTEALG
jgi:hypothetical protein